MTLTPSHAEIIDRGLSDLAPLTRAAVAAALARVMDTIQ
jgi:hypothetical protein